MALTIEVAELGLTAIDGLDVDALAVFVGPERPLQGFAGFADWRLCGAISRAIRTGLFHAGDGEALLLPSGGRVAPGACSASGCRTRRSARRRSCTPRARSARRSRAPERGVRHVDAAPRGGDGAVAARLWLEASLRPAGAAADRARRGPRPAAGLGAARASLGAEVEVLAPPSRVEMPSRGRALPHGAVVR